MMKRFLTVLLVAAMLLMATSISWGGNKPVDPPAIPGGGFDTTGATWE